MTIERMGVKAQSLKVKLTVPPPSSLGRSALLSSGDFDSLILEMGGVEGAGGEGAAYPSPFTASLFDAWKFDAPLSATQDLCGGLLGGQCTGDGEGAGSGEGAVESAGSEAMEEGTTESCSLQASGRAEVRGGEWGLRVEGLGSGGQGGACDDLVQTTSARMALACKELDISCDAQAWTQAEAGRWCAWVLRSFNVPATQQADLAELSLHGAALCALSKRDFETRLPHVGAYLYAELELWRNVYCLMSTTFDWGRYESLVHQMRDISPEREAAVYTDLSTAYPPVGPEVSTARHAGPSAGSEPRLSESRAAWPPAGPFAGPEPRLSDSRATWPPAGPPAGPGPRPSDSRAVRPGTLLIPQFVLDANACTPMTDYVCGGSKLALRGPFDPRLPQVPLLALASSDSPIELTSCESSLASCADFSNSSSSSANSSPFNSLCASSSFDSLSEQQLEAQYCVSRSSGKQSNHLWQFLKELLQQPYESSIRWVDQSKGIFKIEDSSRVAKLWGQRKNRPAMNYDKLSRSIRQYYKKGIIKKTSHSKRLVYQFCPAYA